MAKCRQCGRDAGWMMQICDTCSQAATEKFEQQEAERKRVEIQKPRSPVVNRYQDAYRVGAALVGLGNTIKVVGMVLAGIIGLGSLSAGNGPFGLAGLVLAAIVGGLFWVCGVIVAAQGQVLQATLDNAVASSHFLTDPERADAMGLPRSVADCSGL